MSTKRQGPIRLYWDSCIFFAWIKDEPLPESVKKGIEQTIERAYAGEVVIVTSTIALTEVLQSKMTQAQKEKYQKAFHHPNLQLVDVDRRIAAKAAVIREFYDTRTYDKKGNCIGGSFMSLGDSLHVATAIHIGVHRMHTLDGSGKRQRRLDLLTLNDNVAGSRLFIAKPAYIEPLKPLEGPLRATPTGTQGGLFEALNSFDCFQRADQGDDQGQRPLAGAPISSHNSLEEAVNAVHTYQLRTNQKAVILHKDADERNAKLWTVREDGSAIQHSNGNHETETFPTPSEIR